MRERRRFDWLHLAEGGMSTREIARGAGCSVRCVQLNLATAKAECVAFAESLRLLRPPGLVLFFPINGLFPISTCHHDQVPIADGSVMCCAVCHQSGRDDHPALERFPLTDPKPDPPTSRPRPDHVTRKQRRAGRLPDHAGRAGTVSAA